MTSEMLLIQYDREWDDDYENIAVAATQEDAEKYIDKIVEQQPHLYKRHRFSIDEIEVAR